MSTYIVTVYPTIFGAKSRYEFCTFSRTATAGEDHTGPDTGNVYIAASM